eukprot:4639455-Pleurochrysis_carterae.AAC.5
MDYARIGRHGSCTLHSYTKSGRNHCTSRGHEKRASNKRHSFSRFQHRMRNVRGMPRHLVGDQETFIKLFSFVIRHPVGPSTTARKGVALARRQKRLKSAGHQSARGTAVLVPGGAGAGRAEG